jgi:hypothetical protein
LGDPIRISFEEGEILLENSDSRMLSIDQLAEVRWQNHSWKFRTWFHAAFYLFDGLNAQQLLLICHIKKRFGNAGIPGDDRLFEHWCLIPTRVPGDELEEVFDRWMDRTRDVSKGNGGYVRYSTILQ